MDAKPATVTGEVACSAPPTTITSASPCWIMRMPKPMLCVPVVQAVTTAMFGPRKPYLMERLPEIMLMTLDGTKNGDTRPGPAVQADRVRRFDGVDAADAGTDGNADAFGIAVRLFDASVAHGLDAGDHAVLNEGVEPPRLLALDVVRHLDVFHLGGDGDALAGGVEGVDRRRSAGAGEGVPPRFVHGVADGRQQAETGHGDTSFAHASS